MEPTHKCDVSEMMNRDNLMNYGFLYDASPGRDNALLNMNYMSGKNTANYH